jgi:hypothetical protein
MCAIDGITGMAALEDRIQAVMRALDLALDTPAGSTDWETHLRELAIIAIEAGDEHGFDPRTSARA